MARVEDTDTVEESIAAEGHSAGAGVNATRDGRAPRPEAAARSFKLRFAAHGEPGRSNLSAISPLGLPAPVTDKFYARRGQHGTDQAAAEADAEARALALVRARFARGPRDIYPQPVTTAQEYGWWCGAESARGGAAGRHHIHDSAWLRARLRLLAPDAAYKRR